MPYCGLLWNGVFPAENRDPHAQYRLGKLADFVYIPCVLIFEGLFASISLGNIPLVERAAQKQESSISQLFL